MSKPQSILPEDYLEKRIARRTNVICLSLFFVVMLGTLAAYFVTDRQWDEIYKQQEQTNFAYEAADAEIQQLGSLQEQKQRMLRKAKITSALVEPVPRSRILSELINHMPTALVLREFELKTSVAAPTSRPRTSLQRAQDRASRQAQNQAEAEDSLNIEVPEMQVSISLIGLAPTDVEVAQFISALQNHPLFDRVSLQYTEQTEVNETVMREFELTMQIAGDVDLSTVEATQVPRGLGYDPMSDTVEFNAGLAH